jgi:hypothetical protein
MPELEHAQPTLPILSLSSDEALESQWRYWIRLETRRRTAFVVYVLDTLAFLEFGVRPSITQTDIAALPVPASDSLWCAPTKEAWALAVQSYSPMTVDEAMRRVFFLPECGVFDAHHAESGQRYYQLLNQYEFGPFARVIMIVTLLHGVIDIGEGKRDLGSKSQLREAWLTCMIPEKPFEDSEESVLKFIRSGLEKVSLFATGKADISGGKVGTLIRFVPRLDLARRRPLRHRTCFTPVKRPSLPTLPTQHLTHVQESTSLLPGRLSTKVSRNLSLR